MANELTATACEFYRTATVPTAQEISDKSLINKSLGGFSSTMTPLPNSSAMQPNSEFTYVADGSVFNNDYDKYLNQYHTTISGVEVMNPTPVLGGDVDLLFMSSFGARNTMWTGSEFVEDANYWAFGPEVKPDIFGGLPGFGALFPGLDYQTDNLKDSFVWLAYSFADAPASWDIPGAIEYPQWQIDNPGVLEDEGVIYKDTPVGIAFKIYHPWKDILTITGNARNIELYVGILWPANSTSIEVTSSFHNEAITINLTEDAGYEQTINSPKFRETNMRGFSIYTGVDIDNQLGGWENAVRSQCEAWWSGSDAMSSQLQRLNGYNPMTDFAENFNRPAASPQNIPDWVTWGPGQFDLLGTTVSNQNGGVYTTDFPLMFLDIVESNHQRVDMSIGASTNDIFFYGPACFISGDENTGSAYLVMPTVSDNVVVRKADGTGSGGAWVNPAGGTFPLDTFPTVTGDILSLECEKIGADVKISVYQNDVLLGSFTDSGSNVLSGKMGFYNFNPGTLDENTVDQFLGQDLSSESSTGMKAFKHSLQASLTPNYKTRSGQGNQSGSAVKHRSPLVKIR